MRMLRPPCIRVRSSSSRSCGTVSGGTRPPGVDCSEETSPSSKRRQSRASTMSLPWPTEPLCSSLRSTGSPAWPSSWPSPVFLPSRRHLRTRRSARRILGSRTGVGEPAELRILSGVVVLESGSLETRHGRHAEFRALRGEASGLVQVQLFLLTRHGVLDPREGEVVDLSRVDTDCGRSEEHTSELQSRFDLVC